MLIRLGSRTPRISPHGTWIAPTATLIGDVVLEDEASVWFGAVLRADNEPIQIGRRTNVQDLCVLHTDPGFPLTVGANCIVGHHATLHGCVVGDESLIGIGAIVLNGARVGQRCLIGAGALVSEGVEIPDRSLVVGVPGKVKRELTDREIQRLERNAAVYVERAREYREHSQIIE